MAPDPIRKLADGFDEVEPDGDTESDHADDDAQDNDEKYHTDDEGEKLFDDPLLEIFTAGHRTITSLSDSNQ